MMLFASGSRRNDSGLESQGALDKSSDSGRGLCVSDIGFDRADRGRKALVIRFAPSE